MVLLFTAYILLSTTLSVSALRCWACTQRTNLNGTFDGDCSTAGLKDQICATESEACVNAKVLSKCGNNFKRVLSRLSEEPNAVCFTNDCNKAQLNVIPGTPISGVFVTHSNLDDDHFDDPSVNYPAQSQIVGFQALVLILIN